MHINYSRNRHLILKFNGYRSTVIILLFNSALLIAFSSCDVSEDRPISGDSWSESKDYGPLSYSIEQNEGRYENFKTKTILKGQVVHNATGCKVDFRTAIVEELSKCPTKGDKLKGTIDSDMDSDRLLCETLIQHTVIEGLKLKKRKININIKEGVSLQDNYYKLMRYKAKIDVHVPPLSMDYTVRLAMNQFPLKDMSLPKQIDNLEYPVDGHHFAISVSSPYKLDCSGDLIQASSPFERLDDENIRLSMPQLEYYAAWFKAEVSGNFTAEMPKFICKLDTSTIPFMESAPFLFNDFQLHLRLKISKRDICPRFGINFELGTYPFAGIFASKVTVHEICHSENPKKSNLTFTTTTSSTFFPMLDTKSERSIIIDTIKTQSWTDMLSALLTGGLDEKNLDDLMAFSLLQMAGSSGVDVDKLSRQSGNEIIDDIILEAKNLWSSGTSDSKRDTGSGRDEL